MPDALREPLASYWVSEPRALDLEDGAAYVFALSLEDRSRLAPDWMQRHGNTLFVEVVPDERSRAQFLWAASGDQGSVRLRSERELDGFLNGLSRRTVYVDISGLPHFVWLPLIRACLRLGMRTMAVYAEPKKYVPGKKSPAAGIYSLSERLSNAEPLPGFASLSRETEPPVLVSLLGFEGGRFARVQQIVQTSSDRTFPLIGIPGFELEYPFIAYFGNRLALRHDDCWMNMSFAAANCPFSLLYELERLADERMPPSATVKIAMIGTKPHALGALLFFLRSTRDVELLYDHPIRTAGRTTGVTRCWVYCLSSIEYEASRLS